LEAVALALCCLALVRTKDNRGRWIWGFVVAWLALNVIADTMWGVYGALGQRIPHPGPPDVAYLASYLAAIGAVLIAACKACGRLRTIEAFLDATMFTLGVSSLTWNWLLDTRLEGVVPGSGFWVKLAYLIADLVILFAFTSFFLRVQESAETPRPYYFVLCVAFLAQTVADTGYAAANDYTPGSWLDPVWLLAFALAGIAALTEMRAAGHVGLSRRGVSGSSALAGRPGFGSSRWRLLIPYTSIPIVATMLYIELRASGWWWTPEAWVLTYSGLALIGLLLIRQYITLAQNRRLNLNLTRASSQLAEKLNALADLNARLEGLNSEIHVLNGMRDQRSIAEEGLRMACSFAKAPGGWITLRNEQGIQLVTATLGPVALHRPGESRFNALEVAKGVLVAVPIETRAESLGSLWLVRPENTERTPVLLSVIAAQIGTALDNTKSYQEALHLAERDALTGLFNHRGIHKRLAGESLRAQQNRTELSLVMIDMDDFKALNDTYGHPVGDSVLRHLSDSIRGVLRHADLAGRVGGDELLLVLPNTTREGAMQLGDRLRERLRSKPYMTEGGDVIRAYVSLGVATFPTDSDSLAGVIEIADTNLYLSKQKGGDAVTGGAFDVEDSPEAASILRVAGKLLDVVGARDHYTRKHSEHVAVYALSLGHSLGLSDESLSTLHVAAMLHDIGKIGVPADLLRKTSTLNPAERDLVRRHVGMSGTVIKDIPRLAAVAEAVNSHYERHDGGGCPDETAGSDIPLLGRILAVADAYSAMITDRPYRNGMSAEEARAELLRASGTQLDPELVRQFLHLIDTRKVEPAIVTAEVG
jgi:diguanylate cyclase (GGDEF)-like protein